MFNFPRATLTNIDSLFIRILNEFSPSFVWKGRRNCKKLNFLNCFKFERIFQAIFHFFICSVSGVCAAKGRFMKQLCVSASTGEVNYVWKSRYKSPYMVHKNKMDTVTINLKSHCCGQSLNTLKNDQSKSGELLLFCFPFVLSRQKIWR